MSWAHIPPWVEPLWQQWQSAYREDRLPHAIVLTGPAGNGKREIVEAFVRGAQCRNPDKQGLPCEHCPSCIQFPSCHRIEESAHPDIAWLRVARYSIGIDDIREHIIGRLLKKANYDGNKMLVIEAAERMTPAAMNALLKNLEEPPPKTHFFLITPQTHRLLPTIRSRCQCYVLPKASSEQALAWLCEQSLREEEARQALDAADGMPVQALHMRESGQMQFRQDFDRDLLQVLSGKQLETHFAQNWNTTAAKKRSKKDTGTDMAEEIPMDLRLNWMIQFGIQIIQRLIAKQIPAPELQRAMKAYRELLMVREYEAATPAPQLNLEAACLALMKIPGIREEAASQ